MFTDCFLLINVKYFTIYSVGLRGHSLWGIANYYSHQVSDLILVKLK